MRSWNNTSTTRSVWQFRMATTCHCEEWNDVAIFWWDSFTSFGM